MKTFFGQRCTDVYFTSAGSFLMHYSKRYKNCRSQSRGIVFVFVIVIIPDFVFKCIAKLFFFLQQKAINCPLPLNICYWMTQSTAGVFNLFFSYLGPPGGTKIILGTNTISSWQYVIFLPIPVYRHCSRLRFFFLLFSYFYWIFEIQVSNLAILTNTFIKHTTFNRCPFPST